MQSKVIKKMSNTLIALLITMIFLIVISSVWGLYYAVNDDVTIGQRLSGCYTGIPRPAANDLQYVLALIISTLYRVFPSVDVYGLFLMGSHYVCLFLIIKRVLYKFADHKRKACILLCSVFMVLEIQNIIFFQFTTTAAIYAVTGLFLLLTDDIGKRMYLTIICLFLAFCVRKQVFIMAFPFLALAWAIKIYQNKHDIKRCIKTALLYFLILCVLLVGSNSVHKLVDREHFYNESLNEFISGRKNIRDYDGVPDFDSNIEFYQSLGETGLSKAEYRLIRYQMVCMDFSTDIHEIVKEMHQYNIRQKGYMGLKYRFAIAKEKISSVFSRMLVKSQVIMLLISFLLMSVCFLLSRKWIWFLGLFGGLLGVIAETAYLLYQGRLNERVTNCFILIAVIWMFAIFTEAFCKEAVDAHKKNRYQAFYAIMVLAYVAMFILKTFPAIGERQEEYAKRYHMSSVVNEYCAAHQDNIYFSCYNFLSGDTNKLGKKYDLRFENRIRIGLLPFTPAYYERLERAGISGTIEEAITTQDNVYLMGQNVEGQLPELDRYFEEKYGDAYSYEVVDILDDSIYIIKVHLS